MAASRKEKHTEIEARHTFQPIAMETLGVFSSSARHFLSSLGRRISTSSGQTREACFLFQLLQRFNAVLLHVRLRGLSIVQFVGVFFHFFSSQIPQEYIYRGYENNNNN